MKNALIILSHQDPMYQIYDKEEKNLKLELMKFNRLKENLKKYKIEIKKKMRKS